MGSLWLARSPPPTSYPTHRRVWQWVACCTPAKCHAAAAAAAAQHRTKLLLIGTPKTRSHCLGLLRRLAKASAKGDANYVRPQDRETRDELITVWRELFKDIDVDANPWTGLN